MANTIGEGNIEKVINWNGPPYKLIMKETGQPEDRRAYEAKTSDFGKLRVLLTATERNAVDAYVIHGRTDNPAACRRGLRVLARERRD